MKIQTKILIFILLSIFSTSFIFSYFLLVTQKESLMQGIDEKLKIAAYMAKESLPVNYHDKIENKNSVSQERYNEIVSYFNNACKELDIQYIWSNIKIENQIYFSTASSPDHSIENNKHASFFSVHNDPDSFSEVFKTMKPTFSEFQNEWGHGKMLLIPFIDAQNRPYVFGASVSLESVNNSVKNTFYDAIKISLTISFIMLALGFILSHSLSKPIMKIATYARKISKDETADLEDIKGNYEVESLSSSINNMIETLREKEKALMLEKLMDVLPIAIGTIDKDLNFTHSNKYGAKLFNMTPEELLGESVSSYLGEHGTRFCEDLMYGDESGLFREVPLEINNSRRIMYGIGTRFIDKNHGIIIGIDITEKIQQENLLIAQSRLAAMGEMIGNIAHQWRQPLSTIGIEVQNIQITHEFGSLNTEFLNDHVPKIMEQIQYLSTTIDDFRTFFQPDQNTDDFYIDKIIEEALAIHESVFKQNVIDVKHEVNAVTPCMVHGYASRFKQVVLIILQNAIDQLLTIENGREITVKTYCKDEHAIIEISDNGGGISKENMEKIFDPYFTTKGPEKGTGIGLYMCKAIIEKHMNGSIKVNNDEKGALFIITLQLSDAD